MSKKEKTWADPPPRPRLGRLWLNNNQREPQMTIKERLEAVERELAETKAGLSEMKAQGAEKVIRAKTFVVEDENNEVRAVLIATKKGSSAGPTR